jgi:hypothetical protein
MVAAIFIGQDGNAGAAMKAEKYASSKRAGGGGGGAAISAATAAERAENTEAIKLLRTYDRRLNIKRSATASERANKIASRQSVAQLKSTVSRVSGKTATGKTKAALKAELERGIRSRMKTSANKAEDRVLNNPRANYIMGARGGQGGTNTSVLGRGQTGRNRRRVFIGA